MSPEANICPDCGSKIPKGQSIHGQCPKCLLLLGLGAESEERKKIDAYEILGKLGKGGMGVVYRAYERALNRVVALKVLPERLTESPDLIRRFRREAQAAASLNHPNIVPIFAIGEADGVHYFTMELVRGMDLARYCREKGTPRPRQVVNIASQVADALDAAHEAGILHRDIKPHNIMIDRSGRVRVMDFGLAKRTDEYVSKLTADGVFLGTVHYASPEQCGGDQVGPESDLYSLGVVMYELLTGELPYSAKSSMKMIRQKILGQTRNLADVRPDLAEEFLTIINRLLEVDPERRFASARDLKEALHKLDEKNLVSDRYEAETAAGSMPAMALEDSSGVGRLSPVLESELQSLNKRTPPSDRVTRDALEQSHVEPLQKEPGSPPWLPNILKRFGLVAALVFCACALGWGALSVYKHILFPAPSPVPNDQRAPKIVKQTPPSATPRLGETQERDTRLKNVYTSLEVADGFDSDDIEGNEEISINTVPAVSPQTPNTRNLLESLRFAAKSPEFWKQMAETPLARPADIASVGVIEGQISVIGADKDNASTTNTNKRFDPESNKWTIQRARAKPGEETRKGLNNNAVLDDEIFFIGGHDIKNNRTVRSVDKFNFKNNAWTMNIAEYPYKVQDLCTVPYENKIFCFGGSAYNSPPRSEVFAFDSINLRFEGKTRMPAPRSNAKGFVHDEEIWICGGYRYPEGALNRIDIYDPEEDQWTNGPTMPLDMHPLAFAGKLDNGMICIIYDTPANGPRPFVLDQARGNWISLPPAPVGQRAFSCAAVGNSVYCIGGSEPNASMVQALNFKPINWGSVFADGKIERLLITYNYQRDRKGADIGWCESNGKNLIPLTADLPAASCSGAYLSPDQSKILYYFNDAGDWKLYVMNADGSDKRFVYKIPDSYQYRSPSGWLDTETILYQTEYQQAGTTKLNAIKLDGTHNRVLIHPDHFDEGTCVLQSRLSPSGEHIAFASQNGPWSPSFDILISDKTGEKIQVFFADPGDRYTDVSPFWSKDGSRIYWQHFQQPKVGVHKFSLYYKDFDLDSPVEPAKHDGVIISDLSNTDYAVTNQISPDGKKLLLATRNNHDMYHLDLESGNLTEVFSWPRAYGNVSVYWWGEIDLSVKR